MAINRTTRNMDWYYSLNQNTNTICSISGDLLVVLGKNEKIACIDLITEKARWEKNLIGRFDTSLVVTNKYIFIGDSSSTLYMLSIEDGSSRWYEKFKKGFFTIFVFKIIDYIQWVLIYL